MKNIIITIDSNQANDYNLKKLEINRKHINEAISRGEYDEVQKLAVIIGARAKASQMWDSGVAKVEVSYSI